VVRPYAAHVTAAPAPKLLGARNVRHVASHRSFQIANWSPALVFTLHMRRTQVYRVVTYKSGGGAPSGEVGGTDTKELEGGLTYPAQARFWFWCQGKPST
jgi:hypothetical protein